MTKHLFYILLPFSLLAQQPLNLDFEMMSIEGIERPWGWHNNTWKKTFKMDSLTVYKGNYSLYSNYTDTTNHEFKQSIAFEMEPYELKDKRIKLLGYVKGEKVKKASFSITYWVNKNIEIKSRELSGSFNWKKVSLIHNIPEKAKRVKVNITHEGVGKVWFDEFQLKINGRLVNKLQIAEPFTQEQIDWLEKKSYTFDSPFPVMNEKILPNEELSFFKRAVSDSKVVALGESTHGTSEFFSLKHKLLQYAVEELGFRVFALEDHMIFGENVDRYVKTGKGNAYESMKGCFSIWKRQEVLKMIQWIRAYNKQHPNDMISFIGYDMQNITPSMNKLSEFLKKQDIKLYNKKHSELEYLRKEGEKAFLIRDSLRQLKNIERAKTLYDQIVLKKKEWGLKVLTKKELLTIEYGIQYANLVKQYFEIMLNNDEKLYRDKAMAENIIWYMKNKYPNKKIIVWAHDTHISRGDHPNPMSNLHYGVSMGSFLSKKFKNKYKSFGMYTYQGNYRAFKTYTYQDLVECPLFKSPKGSLEEAMHQVSIIKKSKYLFFSIPRTQEWLNKVLPTRFTNHVNHDYGYWTRYSIPYQFDGIFFIDKTSSALLME